MQAIVVIFLVGMGLVCSSCSRLTSFSSSEGALDERLPASSGLPQEDSEDESELSAIEDAPSEIY